MPFQIQYVASLDHVREVSLTGLADLNFWLERLAGEDLVPLDRDGHAVLSITAADSRFLGIRFRELSFSVLVSRRTSQGTQEGCYLIQAFNTVRWFAFCERAFFSTPYLHGEVSVSVQIPASIRLMKRRQVLFGADMESGGSAPARQPSRTGEEGWTGPVFLPRRPGVSPASGKLFFARISGLTRIFPFVPGRDRLALEAAPGFEAFQALADSRFVAKEWVLREDAAHAKSKTYERKCLELVSE